jgi:shikimate kinase
MQFGVTVESHNCSLAAKRRKNVTQAMSRSGKRPSPGRAKEAASGRPRKRASGSNLGPRRVFLIGFMGAGKTSVGRALSRLLGWRFVDLDDLIQGRQGRTIRQIFNESGEAGFRRAEHVSLRELLAESEVAQPLVVALGGGAFAQAENAVLLRDTGSPSVYLDAPTAELWRRCLREPAERPLRQNERQFRELYEARRPHYLKASWRVDTSHRNVESIAREIVARLGLKPADGGPRDSGKEK